MLEKRKQTLSNEEWVLAMEQIEDVISLDEVDSIAAQTIQDIQKKANGKNVAYAWSGGKDSIVLDHICQKAGIGKSMIALTELEYPAFEKWCLENAPQNCTVMKTGQDLKWLSEHQFMLFPQESSNASHWFSIVQHSAQKRYFKENNLDMILLGRRKADGNYVGKGTNIYTDGKGITRYSPLSEWSHIQILAYLRYYNLPLPPIYQWKNGYLCGTHPWPARQHTGSIENGWKEVYDIDQSVVVSAAELIPSAAKFLEVMGS